MSLALAKKEPLVKKTLFYEIGWKHGANNVHIAINFENIFNGINLHITILMGIASSTEDLFDSMPTIEENVKSILGDKKIELVQSPIKDNWFVPSRSSLDKVVECHLWLIKFLHDNGIHLVYEVPRWLSPEKNEKAYREATAAYNDFHQNAMAGDVRYPIVCHVTKIDGDSTISGSKLEPIGISYFGGWNRGICNLNAPDCFLFRFDGK